MAKKKNEDAAASAPSAAKASGSDLGALSPQAPLSAKEQAQAKAAKVAKVSAQKERYAKAAEILASKATQAGFGPAVGLIVPYQEKNGKIVPAIVSELRLRPAVGFKPGESQVEAVALVLSAHTSRTYTVHIPIKEA